MKYIIYVFITVLFLTLHSCADDLNINEAIPMEELGLLRMTETEVDADTSGLDIELTYDIDSNLIGINTIQGGLSNVNYSVEYENDSIVSLTITEIFNIPNTQKTTRYEVVYDSIIISLVDNDTLQFSLATNDDFVNGYREYFGPENAFFNEVIFARNIDDDIVSMTESTTGIDGQLMQVVEFSYSNLEVGAVLHSAYNPVVNTNTSYDPFIGAILNLRLSENPPLKVSQLDINGNFIDSATEGEATTNANQQVTDFSYKVADFPFSCFEVSYTYN